ncbi:hypothetical protein [Prevotella sp. HJM029]|uniref:hypothetical protein n=1 Tax=Prevotella sp. HJM029 TaxID=1433844 RepID=UPI0004ACD747|nr:hypothetical protein [Prevotella sp. HJM029]
MQPKRACKDKHYASPNQTLTLSQHTTSAQWNSNLQKPHNTNAPTYQAKCATDKEKAIKTYVSNPMSKRILKNTPSQSRERLLSLQLPPAAIGYYIAKRNPAATITHHHTTKSSTSDYTFCRRIIGKTTHHNLPPRNIIGKGHDHSLPPCNIVGKDTHGSFPPRNIIGKSYAHILPPFNIGRKDTHGNSPPYNIGGKGYPHLPPPFNIGRKDYVHPLPPFNIGRKDYADIFPPYNIAGRGHAHSPILNIIVGEAIFRDNEWWLSRARAIFTITSSGYRERGHFSR